MPSSISIELLGGIRLLRPDGSVTHFRAQKTGTLLAYLACFPRRDHSREELTELFWPDSDLEAGRTSFRTSLSVLRRDLTLAGVGSGVLLTTRTHVRLNPDRVTTDIQQLEVVARSSGHRCRATRLSELERAVSLYRGPLLPGVPYDWAVQERARIELIYVSALRELSQGLALSGRLDEAIERALEVLAVDPLIEEAHSELMGLYARACKPGSVVKQFRELERLLRQELGTTPSETTTRLFEELRRGKPPDQSAVATAPRSGEDLTTSRSEAVERVITSLLVDRVPRRSRLPLYLARFVGREEEKSLLNGLLSQKEVNNRGTRLVTLTGPAGCGKTRLAVETADSLSGEYDGAIWFVPLADINSANGVPDALCQVLNIAPVAGTDPICAVAEALAKAPSLLLLDNFEHIAEDGAPVLWSLLERVPNLVCLVTSRQRVGLGGEREFPLDPLRVPDRAGTPEHLLQFASVELFVDRARAIRPDFRITRDNAAAVAALCEKLEGIPLALELAAAWSQTLTPGQILARMNRRFDLLTSSRKDLAPRHRTLRGAVEWSYRLLNPHVQRLFARLSVFRGGFTLDAAEVICDDVDALGHLTVLRECSLITAEESGDEMRYRLLETLRDFADEQVSDGERDFVSARHLNYFADFAAKADALLHGPEQRVWLERLAADHDNFRAAMDRSRSRRAHWTSGLRLAASLYFFWHVRGYVHEGYRRLTEMLALTAGEEPGSSIGFNRAGSGDDVREKALRGAGELAYASGLAAEARLHFEQSLAISRGRNHRPGIAYCLCYLGLISGKQGDAVEARSLLEASLETWTGLNDAGGMAHVLSCLGTLSLAQGNDSQALQDFEKSIRLYRNLENRRGIAMVLSEMANVNLRQKDYAAADSLARERLQLARDLKDAGHILHALLQVGQTLSLQGRLNEARAHYERALAQATEMNDEPSIASAQMLLNDLETQASPRNPQV